MKNFKLQNSIDIYFSLYITNQYQSMFSLIIRKKVLNICSTVIEFILPLFEITIHYFLQNK
jgi:hypothetical protein